MFRVTQKMMEARCHNMCRYLKIPVYKVYQHILKKHTLHDMLPPMRPHTHDGILRGPFRTGHSGDIMKNNSVRNGVDI